VLGALDLTRPDPRPLADTPLRAGQGADVAVAAGRAYVLTRSTAGGADRLFVEVYDLGRTLAGGGYAPLGAPVPVDPLAGVDPSLARIDAAGGQVVVAGGGRVAFLDLGDPDAPGRTVFAAAPAGGVIRGVGLAGGAVLLALQGASGGADLAPLRLPRLHVVRVEPGPGAVAPATVPVVVTLSGAVHPATADARAVAVRGPDGGAVAGHHEVVYFALQSQVVFTPAAPLVPGATYTVEVVAPPPGGTFDPDTGVFDAPGLRGLDTAPLAGGVTMRFAVSNVPDAVAPVLAAVEPAYGPLGGGTQLVVRGGAFAATAVLRVAGRPCTGVRASDDGTVLTGVAPPAPVAVQGAAEVAVENPGGLAARLPGGFVYLADLAVTGLTPASSPPQGGGTVAFTGTGFLPHVAVRFGAATMGPAAVFDTRRFTGVIPAGAAGLVDVRVRQVTGAWVQEVVLPQAFLYGSAATSRGAAVEMGPVAEVEAAGGFALALTHAGALEVFAYERQSPVAPRRLRTVPLGGGPAEGLRVADGRLDAVASGRFVTVDVTRPEDARELPALRVDAAAGGAYLDDVRAGPLLVLAHEIAGVELYVTNLTDRSVKVHTVPVRQDELVRDLVGGGARPGRVHEQFRTDAGGSRGGAVLRLAGHWRDQDEVQGMGPGDRVVRFQRGRVQWRCRRGHSGTPGLRRLQRVSLRFLRAERRSPEPGVALLSARVWSVHDLCAAVVVGRDGSTEQPGFTRQHTVVQGGAHGGRTPDGWGDAHPGGDRFADVPRGRSGVQQQRYLARVVHCTL
jgi:hypothetical protein